MELKLNFKLGEKTLNDRYYDPKVLITEFDRLLEKNISIDIGPDAKSINQQTGSVPNDVLVGKTRKYRVSDDNEVWFEVEELSKDFEEWINDHPGKVKLTLFGFGSIDSTRNVQEFMLTSLFTTVD